MARKIHFSRLLDFLSGSALAAANSKVQKGALNRDFDLAKLESKKLRDLIDSNLPTFYIVDANLIVTELMSGLGFSNFVENREYVQQKFPSKKELENFLLKTITDVLNSFPKDQFLVTVDKLNKEYAKLLDTLGSAKTYAKYRNASTRFAFNMRTLLKSSGVYVATDADKIVANIKPKTYLIIGPTFNAARSYVNDKLNEALRAAFAKSYDINLRPFNAKADASERFTIGDFINAGHTAAYTYDSKLIGVNMPFAQEKQFLLSGDSKAEGLETELGPLYLESDYAIKFQQNFVETATNLLNMQFSFVVTMPSKYNTATLRTKEVERIQNYIRGTVLPTIAEQARSKFAGGIVQDMLLDTGASPNAKEFIEQAFRNSILGNPVNRTTKTSQAKKTDKTVFKTTAIFKKPKKLVINSRSGGINIKGMPLASSLQAQQLDLTSLQNIINSLLSEQIRSNMGTGDRRDVLNYRTGRFAESAEVTKLTQGRQGFVTAYYTYMKYPYATFSQGGQQQFPRSRDPKLLISKSIRQIMEKQMITKMRAQLV